MMATNNVSINSICKMLMKNSKFLIFIHESPDADCIGSCFALINTLRSIGKMAYAASSDRIPASLAFLTDGVREFSVNALPEGFEPDVMISVDVASPSQLGAYKELAPKIALSIDHHATHDRFASEVYVDSMARACAEIVY